MTEPSARILLDSISPAGDRLTTMEVVCHRYVLAEFNTHRKFSRNSASSRAIPFPKMLERVNRDPAMPIWKSEQKGMSGGDALTDFDQSLAVKDWLNARDAAVSNARQLADLSVHKSIVNRLLEPFLWHTIIVSSTEWENFFAQRCHPDAQPEIRLAAEAMREALKNSTPTELDRDEWHMPLLPEKEGALLLYTDAVAPDENGIDWRAISAARCARVSYLTHEGKRSLDADMELYQRLVTQTPPHASPLEHVATPWVGSAYEGGNAGNFDGWTQLRHEVL